MTRKRWMILIAGFVVLLTILAAFLFSEPAQPTFKGRRLSEWVTDITPALSRTPLQQGRVARGVAGWFDPTTSQRVARFRQRRQVLAAGGTNRVFVGTTSGGPVPTGMILNGSDPRHLAASEAIREIGTNAVPYLLREIYSRDGKLKTVLLNWWRKQKVLALPFNTALERQQRALPALWELGDSALWTWVEIVTNNAASPDCQLYAAERLMELRESANPALSALLFMGNHPDPTIRRYIGKAIQYCDREGLIAALWNLRQSTNAYRRASGAWSLGFICKNPDMSFPVLVAATKDGSRWVRENALLSLGKFGTNALPITNTIYVALGDSERDVRVAATNALH
jgi:hypothetical protein